MHMITLYSRPGQTKANRADGAETRELGWLGIAAGQGSLGSGRAGHSIIHTLMVFTFLRA